MPSFSIAIVTYNSSRYIRPLIDSIEQFILPADSGDIRLHKVVVVDNCSLDDTLAQIPQREFLEVFQEPRNITHGPALDFAIHKADSEFILILDADTRVLDGALVNKLIGSLIRDRSAFAAGSLFYVNARGIGCQRQPGAFPYVHPYCCGISRNIYLRLKSKFVAHGAPGIEVFHEIERQHQYRLLHVDLQSCIWHQGAGSCDSEGASFGIVKALGTFPYRKKKIKEHLFLMVQKYLGRDHLYRLKN